MERTLEMKKSLASLVLAALAVLLLVGTNASADPIPIQWSFSANPITDNTGAGGTSGVAFPGGKLPSSTSPLSSILFTPSFGNLTGSTGLIIYNMATVSTQSGAPDSFNNVDFLASFTVSDTKTLQTGTVTFHGQYNATNVSPGSLTKGVTNWVNDQGNVSATEASVVLGTGSDVRTYDFQIKPGDFLSSLAPNGGVGSFGVEATATDGNAGSSGEIPPTGTPEPASLVLAGFGLPLFVLMRRRLKKNKSDATVA
jgi:hypothetical protein